MIRFSNIAILVDFEFSKLLAKDFTTLIVWRYGKIFFLKVLTKNSGSNNVFFLTAQLKEIWKNDSKRWLFELYEYNNITQQSYWTLQFSTNSLAQQISQFSTCFKTSFSFAVKNQTLFTLYFLIVPHTLLFLYVAMSYNAWQQFESEE